MTNLTSDLPLAEKEARLTRLLRDLGRVTVAFSSGVDSTFLLQTACRVLGPDNVLAVTARASCFPARENSEAASFCAAAGIRQIMVDFDVLAIDEFRQNPPDRCYICKHALFGKILEVARACGMPQVVEGTNLDDTGDYRPGMRAIAELHIKSPLREAGLTKAEIRQLSQKQGLLTWDKPSFACLASRFPYGEPITAEALRMVDRAEQLLQDLGFRQVRVRVHGTVARIELLPEDMPRLLNDTGTAAQIHRALRDLGFAYVALDLGGYQTGNMNRTLQEAGAGLHDAKTAGPAVTGASAPDDAQETDAGLHDAKKPTAQAAGREEDRQNG